MPANTRLIVFAAGIVAAVAIGYFLLRSPAAPTAADVPRLLQQMPATTATGEVGTPAPWQEQLVLGRYDTMSRAGNLIRGRWANNIKDACIAAAPMTSIPDENAWQQPVAVMQCFDGATVLVINLKE